MVIAEPHETVPRVLLLEPNHQLRRAILDVLTSEQYVVQPCDSLEQVVEAGRDHGASVALVAWQSMGGLLADEHRSTLSGLTDRLHLVLMVPRRWQRLLQTTDLGDVVHGIVAKPFEAEELLDVVRAALRRDSLRR